MVGGDQKVRKQSSSSDSDKILLVTLLHQENNILVTFEINGMTARKKKADIGDWTRAVRYL